MTRKEALEYVNNMYMYEDTKNALETLIPEFGKTGVIDHEDKYKEALLEARAVLEPCLKYSKGKVREALDSIDKELKSFESVDEDERIRRKMIEHFKAKTKETWCNMPVKDIIAYLEKQKIFSKNGEGCYYYHADGSYTFIGSMGFGPIEDIKINGERPKTENKSVSVDLPGACLCEEKQKEPHKRLRDKTPWIVTAKEELAHAEERLQANLEELHRIRAEKEKQKEQEPISFNVPFNPDDYEVVVQGNATGLKQKEQKFTHHEKDESLESAVVHQMEDDADVDDFVRRGIDDIVLRYAKLGARWQKEQKPAECIEDSVKFKEGFKAGRESGLRDGQKYVLNNLDSYGLCKPAEWSEEDENNIGWIVAFLQGEEGSGEVIELMRESLISWLKSLRPSWKPSEEQMEALNKARRFIPYNCDILESLYEQLKKL